MDSVRLASFCDGEYGPPHEKCGILRGRDEKITAADETRNVSITPEVAFEIDPAALVNAYRAQRRVGGLEVLGFYHTHPAGDDVPSLRDAECAAPDGKLWLIASIMAARLWRAVENGVVHGRFVPVRFDLRIGRRVEKNVPGVQHRDFGKSWVALFDPESFR